MIRRRTTRLALLALAISPALAAAQSTDHMARTARRVAALQNKDGGFASEPGGKSSLGSTSSALRILKYNGGATPDVLACIDYVKSCRDDKTGGFAPEPGGRPGVGITASGLMAFRELKVKDEDAIKAAVDYLAENAKGFEEVRIAVAGMEAADATRPVFGRWAELVNENRNDDGTFGKGAALAHDTGGSAVALLRMGVKPEGSDRILAALRESQRPDGGWSKDGQTSDLGTSYRIMRYFFMTKQKPDLAALRSYLDGHRDSEGGYAGKPGGSFDLGATYFCSIMLYWARLLDGEEPVVETAGFTPLFDGKSLDGWEGDKTWWSARDGMLVGKSDGLQHNTFLATEKDYYNFTLKLSFRLVGGEGNSGVQFRSVRVPGTEMKGYQADIGAGYWGSLYDESRRNKVLVQGSDKALEALRPDGWNHYMIRAFDDRITMTLNGVTSVQYREDDPEIARATGKIAVQIHSGGPMEVQFKDILIQPIASPEAASGRRAGFETMTARSGGQDWPFTVFWPEGFDESKSYPAVLFLHGSGERGEDGKVSSYVGLGAAIAGRPADFPFVAIFPQARRTWTADSDDAEAALAALDAVSKAAKIDPDRVYLTGLSMGGAGAWGLAAKHPDRFAALVPICGGGRPETAEAIKGMPTWAFVGDADSDRAVLGMRGMVAALREAGNPARYTEYRGVGHNSWDRAYAEPGLVEWLLEQSRGKR